MSEKTIAEGIQAILQGMDDFSAGDVGIEEWTMLDGSTQNAPFVIIAISDDFDSRQDAKAQSETWEIKVNLYVRFVDWGESRLKFRNTRQNILDEFNEQGSKSRSADITSKLIDIQSIRNGDDVGPWYPPFETKEELLASDPIFLHQEFIFETREDSN